MAPRLRRLSAREVLAALNRLGFEVVATRGSHAKLRRRTADGQAQTLTLPLHRDLDLGTIRAIYRQATRFVPEADLRPWFYDDWAVGRAAGPAGAALGSASRGRPHRARTPRTRSGHRVTR
jgi:predicted RNA binding protein YcfA (HicA-like mRNA interferase family)